MTTNEQGERENDEGEDLDPMVEGLILIISESSDAQRRELFGEITDLFCGRCGQKDETHDERACARFAAEDEGDE